MSNTNNESINTVEPTDANLLNVTPTRPISQIEPIALNHHDQVNTLVEQLEQQTIEEDIVTQKIQRIPFNLDMVDNIATYYEDHGQYEYNEDYEGYEDNENNEPEYIHYCGNKDCEWDCGVLDCGCIDTCRNRCGTRQSFDFD
jgi:hypothetical protein